VEAHRPKALPGDVDAMAAVFAWSLLVLDRGRLCGLCSVDDGVVLGPRSVA